MAKRPVPPALRLPLAALAALQITLFVLARRDLRRRPDDQIRGSRRWWRLATFVNTLGPLAYFRWGRRR
ncbi:hypothetical protein [Patulibacter defluvii]|uniref:hypothetical protein n=1 Tax=Patulibacter defluvii TaxID=3095358 RepID=UPI002A762024|nr:hypothetical protein [Patulibacter sp. DM4]